LDISQNSRPFLIENGAYEKSGFLWDIEE
jgi:hypothetical protein